MHFAFFFRESNNTALSLSFLRSLRSLERKQNEPSVYLIGREDKDIIYLVTLSLYTFFNVIRFSLLSLHKEER